MFRLSITVAAPLYALAALAAPVDEPYRFNDDRFTIVLIGASWCAPCLAELRSLSALADAAAPDHIVVAWDDPEVARRLASPAAHVEIANLAAARRWTARYARSAQGLPFSVMINGRAQQCAEWNRQLTAQAIGQMRKQCELASVPASRPPA